jgi:fatty-acyl-CoA synthase
VTADSLVEAIWGWAARRPDTVALADPERVLSWADLAATTDRESARLTAHGIGPGSRVAVLAPLSLESAVSALALLRVGAAVCPLEPTDDLDHLMTSLDGLAADAVVTAERAVRSASAADGETPLCVMPLARLHRVVGAPAVATSAPSAASAKACVLSGPGGISGYSHEDLLLTFFEWALQVPDLLGARALTAAPLSSAAGLIHGLLAPLVLGGGVVVLPRWEPREALRVIHDELIGVLLAPPELWDELSRQIGDRRRCTGSLHVALVDGPVEADQAAPWADRGVRLRHAVGLTPTAPATVLAEIDEHGRADRRGVVRS